MVNIASKHNLLLLILFTIVHMTYRVSQNGQKNNSTEYRDIASCLDLDVTLESINDTVIFNDKISLTVIFRNKTDTSFYFRPDALVSLTRELHGIFEHDINFTFLSMYSNIDNLVLIKPHGIYSKTYQIVIEKPWSVLGRNEFYIMYLCKALKGHKQQSEVLYGRLQSPIFEIYVKEN